MAHFTNVLTKDQVISTYKHIGANGLNIPKGAGITVLAHPEDKVNVLVTVHPLPGVYGRTMYVCAHVPQVA